MAKQLKQKTELYASLAQLSDPELAEACLAHWAHLGEVLPRLAEPEVRRLLAWELGHRRNPAIVLRLHQRWARLRTHREQEKLQWALRTGSVWELPSA